MRNNAAIYVPRRLLLAYKRWRSGRSKCQASSGHNPKNTLFAIKRLIGRRYKDDVVQEDIMVRIKLL